MSDEPHTDIARDVPVAYLPKCIGVIMDGNRRWAKRHGKTPAEGHYRGYQKLVRLMQWAKQERVPHIVVYGFSTENARRSTTEVDALMELFREFYKRMTSRAVKNDVQIRFIGSREHLPRDIQTGMGRLEHETRDCRSLTLTVAAPYGARAELVDALERIRQSHGPDEPITEDLVNRHLWTADIPDPDLIVRTGGRKRLSNFLLWQAAYSELLFTETLWPAFTRREFTRILYEFSRRTRTHGR